jgi:hypothetical protein
MTRRRGDGYCQPAMNELQHGGAFVIQFRAGTDFCEGRVVGRIEHIASGRCGQFESASALLELLARLLEDWRTGRDESR